jgi:hypothetical protein
MSYVSGGTLKSGLGDGVAVGGVDMGLGMHGVGVGEGLGVIVYEGRADGVDVGLQGGVKVGAGMDGPHAAAADSRKIEAKYP